MADDLVLKLVALVVFSSVVGGATYAAYDHLQPEGVEVRALVITPVEAQKNATAGHAVTFAVKVHALGTRAENVTLTATGAALGDAQEPVPLQVQGGGAKAGAFVPVALPAGLAPGDYTIKIRASTPDAPRAGEATVTLRVLAPAQGLVEGEEAQLLYVGRFADGGLFNTNHPALANDADFARDAMYSAGEGALAVRVGQTANVIQGFASSVEGIQVGESRTFRVAPEDGYGEAFVNETAERVSEVDRRLELPLRTDKVPRRSFDQYINSTGQGPLEKFAAGSTFELRGQGGSLPFEVVNITAAEVHYRIAVELNESYTIYGYFPNASKVVLKNETHVVFETTPQLVEGARFTFHEYWPQASAVDLVTADKIHVKHTPQVGSTYEAQTSPFAPPREYTVLSVNDAEIVVQYPNPSPLGGKTLVFDVTRVG